MGFFTDTSVCIGCKACEVACKEWNHVPEDGINLLGMSYDNTGGLGASTWRHVAFIEQIKRPGDAVPGLPADSGGSVLTESVLGEFSADGSRWLMASNVCKHCTESACLDVCPTGALMRTEFGTVVVQSDVCNGCGYCVPACPFGVIERREGDGRAWKCTLCYDRIGDGLEPACAKACPTQSIQFGPVDELRERAQSRVSELHEAGESGRAALPGGPRRRHRRRRRVLPAAGRAGGVRAAAGPGGHHAGPAPDVAARGRGGGRPARRRPGRGAATGPAPMSRAGGRAAGRPAGGNGVPGGTVPAGTVPAGRAPALAARMRERFGVHGRGQHERARQDRGGQGQGQGQSRAGRGGRGGRGGEQLVVPRARPDSYYGKPIIKEPVWGARDVGGYLFFGGLAGASSVLAGFAQAAGNHRQAKASKIAAVGAIGLSGLALVADLGRPERFVNMLRVVKVTSPMSVGSWLISAFGGASAAAAACAVTGRLPRAGAAATAGAAAHRARPSARTRRR